MTGAWEPISCFKYEELRADPAMRVHSTCTNYVGGEVLNPWLPPHSYISHQAPRRGPRAAPLLAGRDRMPPRAPRGRERLMPKRIQRHRTKGWRMPEGAIYVGRPTIWGNPYRVVRQGKTTWEVYAFEDSSPTASFVSRTGVEARAFAVERLLCLIDNHRDPWGADRIRNELAGSDLACWCPLGQPCHADVLLEIANRGEAA